MLKSFAKSFDAEFRCLLEERGFKRIVFRNEIQRQAGVQDQYGVHYSDGSLYLSLVFCGYEVNKAGFRFGRQWERADLALACDIHRLSPMLSASWDSFFEGSPELGLNQYSSWSDYPKIDDIGSRVIQGIDQLVHEISLLSIREMESSASDSVIRAFLKTTPLAELERLRSPSIENVVLAGIYTPEECWPDSVLR